MTITREQPWMNWALVLAGGSGRRLQPLTRQLTGDDRPKQFCSLFGGSTLLGSTRARVGRSVAPHRTLCVMNREHERYYRDELADLSPSLLVDQPCDRGTAAAIAYGIARIHQADPDAVVGIFPVDHHYANPGRLHATLVAAYSAARRHPAFVFLLGAEPDRAETDYGWIETGEALADIHGVPAFTVARFWEKPLPPIARLLVRRRALWNTFVMVGHVNTFRSLLRVASSRFAGKFDHFDATGPMGADQFYPSLPKWDFSHDVLTSRPGFCAVIALEQAGWTDLGRPERVAALAQAAGALPGRVRIAI
jgi:mannose-1-phosphate guanylyltransferase